MDGSAPSDTTVPRLLAHIRERDRSGPSAIQDEPEGRADAADEIVVFARKELDRISDYVAQQVSELSGRLKTLRAQIKQQSRLIDEMALGLEAALPALDASNRADRDLFDDVLRQCFVNLRQNVESLGQHELSLAASLQFQDRIAQEMEQLNHVLDHGRSGKTSAEIEAIAAAIKLADFRTRFLEHFGRETVDTAGADDDVELF